MSSNNSNHLTPAAIPFIPFHICRNLPPLPSSRRGLGRGWLYGPHEFDFSPNHKATPILTFPRQTGEGTELLINQRGRLKIRILDFRRPHSISFNNSKHPTCHYLLPYFSTSTATCPLSRLAGEGWGEGGSMSCTNLFSPQKHKTTPILTFPRQTGEGTKLLIRQRGRLKTGIYEFQTTSFIIRPRRTLLRRHSRAGGNPLVG